MASRLSSRGWIDVTIPLRTGMARWPGDPGVRIERRLNIDRGDADNLSAISMSAHTGTHMDAPLHFLKSGKAMDEMPLSAVMGPARVIEIADPESIKPGELLRHKIRRGERILFKTLNSSRVRAADAFFKDYVHISKEAASLLATRRIRTVGIDYLSVGGYKRGGVQTHVTLLKAGIWIIEGLDLFEVKPGNYDLVALPLKIAGGDGAPARVLLKRHS
jgi:arylformamidase